MKLLPFFLLVTFFCFGQQEQSLVDQKEDSIAFYLEYSNDSLKFHYLKRAILLAEEVQNDSLLRESVIKYANTGYFGKDNVEKGLSLTKLKDFYIKKKDSFALAKILHIKAMTFKKENLLDSSFYYYQESKNVSLAIMDSLEVGRRLLSMANMQYDEGDYLGAEVTIVEGLKYLEPKKEYTYTPHSLVTLGAILTALNRFEEAREYYKKASDLYEKNESIELIKREQLNILNNIGNTYLLEFNPSKALEYLEKGLQYDSIQTKFIWHYKRLLGNAAESYYLLNQKEKAWKELKKVLKVRQETNDIYGQSLSHNGFAYYYQLENQNKKALFHARKGYELDKEVNNRATRLSALEKLANLTSGAESKEYMNEYISLRDSLSDRERYLKNQFAKVRYETEKKDKENADLKLTKEQNEREIERQKQQKLIGWLFSLAAVLALVLSFTFYRSRRKKLMYEAQLQKASAREEERQQIAKSLHDEVAGDLRMLHQKLAQSDLPEEAQSIEKIKENVRNLSHQLSSESFDEVSFKDQIINLISDAFSPNFRVSVSGIDAIPWKEVNPQIKRTLYLCARESLQNTQKYASATQFSIVFLMQKKEISLEMKDNGKGIDEGKKSKGIGLKNLKERVEEIHGTFHISSSEEGTTTNVSIPVNG